MSAADAARDLNAALDGIKCGSLRVFGDWFGKPMDNWHVPVGARASGNVLHVEFNGAEELALVEPRSWTFDADVFRIDFAIEVRWSWYSYGMPQTEENRFTILHQVQGESVTGSSDVDWYVPNFDASLDHAAAELL